MNKLGSTLVIVSLLAATSCKKESASAAAPPPVTKTAEPAVKPAVQPAPSPEADAPDEVGDTARDPSTECSNVDVTAALESAPADAHAAIQTIATAIKNGDATGLDALLDDAVRRHGTREERDLVLNRIASLGPLDVFQLQASDVHDAATDKVQCLVALQAQQGKAGAIELFVGSGYGETPIVRLAKKGGAWKLVAIETMDLGAP